MSGNSPLARIFYRLCVIQLSILLFGCDDAPYEGPASSQGPGEQFPDAEITASVQEGFNPLNVSFHVSGVSGQLTDVTWNFGDGNRVTTRDKSVSHTFTTPGLIPVTVTIDDPLSSAPPRTIEIDINVLPDVNLIVSSFAIGAEVFPGGENTVSAIIQNTGKDPFTAFGNDAPTFINVGYYLSTDNNITVDDIYIGDTSINVGDDFSSSDVQFGMEALAPGENYQYNHQLDIKGNVPPGSYFAGAIVDYADEFDWYDFPRSTDTREYVFPSLVVVPEINEDDNVSTAHQVSVSNANGSCADDTFEDDDSSAAASTITVGATQTHNFCLDNSDWFKFDAAQGSIYEIGTTLLGSETDTQLILYDQDGISILLFHDNMGTTPTLDLRSGFPPRPRSEIVWEAPSTGTYFIKVRTTACDEDLDPHCSQSPDGVGLNTEYSISLR